MLSYSSKITRCLNICSSLLLYLFKSVLKFYSYRFHTFTVKLISKYFFFVTIGSRDSLLLCLLIGYYLCIWWLVIFCMVILYLATFNVWVSFIIDSRVFQIYCYSLWNKEFYYFATILMPLVDISCLIALANISK